MFRRAIVIILIAFFSMYPFSGHASHGVGGHGVVYFAYDLGTYSSDLPSSSTNNWYVPGRQFKSPVALYNLNPSLVDAQLANMRASGMDYLTLHIKLAELAPCIASGACNSGFPDDWVWGYLLDSSLGTPRPMHMANLRSIVAKARDLGFRNVILRFVDNQAIDWKAWDEVAYQHAWNYIVNVHLAMDDVLKGSATGAIYDLGGESPGLGCTYTDPGCLQATYLNRLWADYTHVFGASDTVGFSAIADANCIAAAFDIYKSVHPARYAFTAYGNYPERDVKESMEIIYRNMPASERGKPVMLMETYQNDPTTASQIANFLAEHQDFNLFAITQWPTTRDPACAGCDGNVKNSSIQALNTTNQLSMMGSIVSRFSQESDHPELMAFSDIDCESSSASVCTVVGHLSFLPVDSRQAFKVYITTPGQQPKLWSCMSATNPVPASWITRNLNYKFDYYRTTDCAADISGQSPDATTRLFVR